MLLFRFPNKPRCCPSVFSADQKPLPDIIFLRSLDNKIIRIQFSVRTEYAEIIKAERKTVVEVDGPCPVISILCYFAVVYFFAADVIQADDLIACRLTNHLQQYRMTNSLRNGSGGHQQGRPAANDQIGKVGRAIRSGSQFPAFEFCVLADQIEIAV